MKKILFVGVMALSVLSAKGMDDHVWRYEDREEQNEKYNMILPRGWKPSEMTDINVCYGKYSYKYEEVSYFFNGEKKLKIFGFENYIPQFFFPEIMVIQLVHHEDKDDVVYFDINRSEFKKEIEGLSEERWFCVWTELNNKTMGCFEIDSHNKFFHIKESCKGNYSPQMPSIAISLYTHWFGETENNVGVILCGSGTREKKSVSVIAYGYKVE